MSRIVFALAILAGTAGVASAQAAFHVTGVTVDHDARPVGGRNVGARFTYDSCTAAGACTPVDAGVWYALSGTDGRFDITAYLPVQPDVYAKNQKLEVSTYGSEASVYRKRATAWVADPAFWTVDVVIRNAPAQVSLDGGYWARRIGCGEYPVFVVEGFDPGDSMKTGDASDPTSWVGLLGASRLNDGSGLLDYFTTHNYSVYLLSSGANSANSIKASPDGDVTKGMAYQSVFLAKTILEQAHPGKPLVMGGYSAGGLTSRAGLTKWCDGSYAGVSGGFLDAGCAALAMWFSGDAPQNGASLPISLQRYLHDDEIVGAMNVAKVQAMVDAPAAQEMLKQSLGSQLCNTNCVDAFGCESTDYDFQQECSVRTNVHDDFMQWIGGFPTRAGGARVPAVAFSLGTAAKDESGVVHRPDACWDNTSWQGRKYLETDVTCWGNHNLYINTAGGTDECVPGSVMNSLKSVLDGYSGDNNWCFGGWQVHVYFAPTYIPTESALDWDNRDARWNDYWYSDVNNPHGGPIASGAGSFLVAWVSEYTTGLQDAPPCTGLSPAKLLGKKGVCRATGGAGSETTLACTAAVEPLQALVGTHAYGTGTPAVGVLRTDNFGAASPTYATNNAGLSGAGLDVFGLELDPFDSDTAYIYGPDGIYTNKRVWGAGTWTKILDKARFEAAAGMTFPTGWGVVHAVPSPTVQGRIHAIVEGQNITETALDKRYRYFALVSNNGGASWTGQQVGQSVGTALGGDTPGSFGIAPSPTDPSKVWLTTMASNFNGCVWFTSCSTLWRSVDGGATWTENTGMRFAYTRVTFPVIPADGNADNLIGFRFRQPVGPPDPLFESSSNGLATTDFGLNPFSQVGGSWANWIRRANGFFVEPTNRGRIVALSNNVFIVSNDGGHTWVLKTAPGIGNGDIVERGPAPWKIAAASSYSYVWYPALYTSIAYTTDLGKTWQKKNGNLASTTTALAMSMSAVRLRP